jgi:ribosome-binding protein aMBF1 (putative translation factor)
MSVKKLKYELFKDKGFKNFYKEHEVEHYLAELIMEERIKKGWPQEELAKRSKVLQPTIGRIEAGHIPNITTLSKIAKGFGKKLQIKFIKK